jgi:hypothetical protein
MNQVIIAYHLNASGEITIDGTELAVKRVPLDDLPPWEFGTGAAVPRAVPSGCAAFALDALVASASLRPGLDAMGHERTFAPPMPAPGRWLPS